MKRHLLLILLAAGVAFLSYALTRELMPRGAEDQMAWLQREFKLDAAQVSVIEKLQANYRPVCAGHCRLIMDARDRLAANPGDAAVQAEIVRLEKICTDATLAHLREVAAQMAPEQERRFLTLVEPKVSRHEHRGPFGLK